VDSGGREGEDRDGGLRVSAGEECMYDMRLLRHSEISVICKVHVDPGGMMHRFQLFRFLEFIDMSC